MQIIVYEPKPGLFPDEGPPGGERWKGMASGLTRGGAEMGLAAGGKMRQKTYPDPHGIDIWDQENYGEVFAHIVNSAMYREVTGSEPPPTPVSAKTYTKHGLPWFDLYDIRASQVKEVKSVKELDAEKELSPQQDDETIEVPEDQIVKYKVDTTPAEDDP